MALRRDGKKFSRKQNKWVDATIKSFDYSTLNKKSAGLVVSFFRSYPDYYCDVCRSPNASYSLAIPQRIMLRIYMRYRNFYITGVRGLTKTYIIVLASMIKGNLFPSIIIRYNAPNFKQAASLATQAFHQIERDYPLIASMWELRNDREDMFRITTPYGSEFTMYSMRGDNSHETIAEEIGQEGREPFDMATYEHDILPACRLLRTVNQKPDPYMVQMQHGHISNACSKHNRAFYIHRQNCLTAMQTDENEFEGYVIDMSWITALVSGLRPIKYFKDQRSTLTETAWKREMGALYIGDSENPLIREENLLASRTNRLMEFKHCGDKDAIYIVSHDVAYVDDIKNAKCGDVVIKCTPYTDVEHRDKYKAKLVWADSYSPPNTDYEQAKKLRDLWRRYCMNGGEATYLVIDAQAYGTGVVEELMKPTDDGSKPLCCVNHMAFTNIEQPHALPVIYPMKATAQGGRDPDSDMVTFAQLEFEQGHVELLATDIIGSVEAYKDVHGIKDARSDAVIAYPYRQCELLCKQISNLQVEVSGTGIKEKRKSRTIQRDIWSALKYALRMLWYIEQGNKKEKYSRGSSWKDSIDSYTKQMQNYGVARANPYTRERASALSLRPNVVRR